MQLGGAGQGQGTVTLTVTVINTLSSVFSMLRGTRYKSTIVSMGFRRRHSQIQDNRLAGGFSRKCRSVHLKELTTSSVSCENPAVNLYIEAKNTAHACVI